MMDAVPAPRPDSTLRRARSSVIVLFVLMGLTTGSWAARIPGVRHQLTVTDAQWGLANLGSTAGSLISLTLVTTLIVRTGPRRLALVGGPLLLINAPLLAGSHSTPALVAGLFTQGIATGLLATPMNAQAVEVERRYGRRIMSSFHACFSLGQLAGGVIGTFAARADVSPSLQLACSGAVLAVVLLLTQRGLPRDTAPLAPLAPFAPPTPHAAVAPDPLSPAPLPPAPLPPTGTARTVNPPELSARARRITPQLLLLAAVALLSSINEGAASQWSAQYTAGALGAGAAAGAVTYTCFTIAMTISRSTGDRLVNRLGQRRFIRLSEAFVAIGFAVALLVGTPVAAFVGFAVLGLGSGCIVPGVMSLAGNQPGIPTGRGVSVVAFGQWPAMLLGPPLIGVIAGLVGLRFALMILVGAAVCIVVLAGWIRQPAAGDRILAVSR